MGQVLQFHAKFKNVQNATAYCYSSAPTNLILLTQIFSFDDLSEANSLKTYRIKSTRQPF